VMFLLYHSDRCNTSETVFHWCYVNDLHTTHAVVCWVTTSRHGFVERTNMFHLVASVTKINLCTSSILFNSFTPSFPVLHHPYPLMVFCVSEMDEHPNYHRRWIRILYFSFLRARNYDVVVLQFLLHWVKLEMNSFFLLSPTLLLMQCDSEAYLLSVFAL
jgi:hypothetical protein